MSSVIQQVEENFRRPLKGLKCTLLKRFYPQLPFASLSRSRHLPSSPRGEQLPHGAIEKHVAPENFPPYWRTKKWPETVWGCMPIPDRSRSRATRSSLAIASEANAASEASLAMTTRLPTEHLRLEDSMAA